MAIRACSCTQLSNHHLNAPGISVSEDMLELTLSMHNQDPPDGSQFSRETGIDVADKFKRSSQTSVLKLGTHNIT